MNQEKFYIYIIFALLALNIGVLSFFIFNKTGARPHLASNNVETEIIRILNLNEQQISTFTVMARDHEDKIDDIREQQEHLISPYFASLTTSKVSTNQDSLLKQFQLLEREKIEATYKHFQEIKKLLSEDQQSDFKILIDKFINRNLSRRKKSPPPPKDFR